MNISFAETLSDQERRTARINAYASAWFGCIAEVMMDSSAIIILYMALMQGSDFMAMMTTTISGICFMFLFIPFAVLIQHIGLKTAVKYACLMGCAGYLLMASAPFFGPVFAKYAILAGVCLYALQRPLYGATWYPMLDAFLRPQDRGEFFGFLRFTYMLLSGAIFFLIGLAMGTEPPVWLMQVTTGVTGLLILGRWYFINQFPEDPNRQMGHIDLRKSLIVAQANSSLTGYSVYACLFSMAYTIFYPLTLIYLKTYVQLPAGQVQILSTVGIAGSVSGFFLYGKLLQKTSLRILELIVHFSFIAIAFLLFFYGKDTPGFTCMITFLIFLTMFSTSIFLCNNSGEIMALATPNNKLMATAFCQTYANIGTAAGRGASSLLIGTVILAPSWVSGSGIVYSKFQSIFLLFGCLLAILLVLMPLMPSIIAKHHDFYDPQK